MCKDYFIEASQRKYSRVKESIFESEKKYSSSINVKCFRSIFEIDEHLWDTINKRQDFFHSYKFLSCIEKSNIENNQLWYLIFFSSEKPVGSAVLSSFKVSLDLFSNKILQKMVNNFRKINSNLLKINILFCGIPISVGKNSFTISNGFYHKEILHSLVLQMELIAIQNEINLISLKEFREDEVIWLNTLIELGFMKIDSLPYVYMRINWQRFDEYLGAMRHNYRRQIQKSLFDKTLKKPIIHNYDPFVALSESSEKLFLFKPSQFDPKIFFKLYLQIMNRAHTKLETLNEDFFINAFKVLEKDSLILAAMKNNEIKGAAYLIIDSKKITFLLVGLDYEYNNHHEVLMNLLYGIVQFAIDKKCKMLELGQTSYELKQRIGGKCINEYFFLKSSNKKLNFILKMLKPILFPVVEINPRRVFNKQPSDKRHN